MSILKWLAKKGCMGRRPCVLTWLKMYLFCLCLIGHRLLGWKVFLKLLDLFLYNHLYHSMLLEKSLILSNTHWLSVLSSLEALRRASFILGIWKFYSDVYEGWSCFHLSSWLIMFVNCPHHPTYPWPLCSVSLRHKKGSSTKSRSSILFTAICNIWHTAGSPPYAEGINLFFLDLKSCDSHQLRKFFLY